MFPKKGPEKKALFFLSNLLRLDNAKRKSVYKKVLKSKKSLEKSTLVRLRRTASSRRKVFLTMDSLVKDYVKKCPGFEGVIIFGGIVKKESPPTDLDFIFVGKLAEKDRRDFSNILQKELKIPTNPFPVEIDLNSNPKRWEELLSTPYLSSYREWVPQNFVGPDFFRRRLNRKFSSALKKVGRKEFE